MITTYTQLAPHSVPCGYSPADSQGERQDQGKSQEDLGALVCGLLWNYGYRSSSTFTISIPFKRALEIRDLGWSESMAFEIRRSLESFADDWEAPGMEAYDDL